VLGQQVVHIAEFCDETNFEKLKKSPRKHKKESILGAISMKNSSDI
jgi:hypothetical protein